MLKVYLSIFHHLVTSLHINYVSPLSSSDVAPIGMGDKIERDKRKWKIWDKKEIDVARISEDEG